MFPFVKARQDQIPGIETLMGSLSIGRRLFRATAHAQSCTHNWARRANRIYA